MRDDSHVKNELSLILAKMNSLYFSRRRQDETVAFEVEFEHTKLLSTIMDAIEEAHSNLNDILENSRERSQS